MSGNSNPKRRKFIGISFILFALIIIMIFISLRTGVISISFQEVTETIFQQGSERNKLVLFEFRLPGIILAILIGIGLAVSGAILQGITQNELADPGIMGINTGAGLAVVLYLFLSREGLVVSSIWMMPVAAMIGALFAAFLIYILAWKKGVSPVRLILVGIGINAGFAAFITIFQLKMDPQDFRQVAVWLSGDIWNANWNTVLAFLPWIVILIPLVLRKTNSLNVLTLGDDLASGLGVHVERDRRILLLLAVALAGASVSAGGAIAFLGLIVPHIARKLIGSLHQYIIPLSMLIGALLIITADTVGKLILAPTEIPVGIVVSIISAPYFIYLLMKAT